MPVTKTARKALGMWVTGFGGWAAMYLPKMLAGFVVFSVAAFITWLIPNDTERAAIEKEAWGTPQRLGHVDPEAGAIDGGGLVLALVCFLLGVLAVKSGLIH